MYGELVYRLGKRYGQELARTPENEFPYFSGMIADIMDAATLPELQGEYIIAYNNGNGTNHLIRVYFEQGAFEAEGTPGMPDVFNTHVQFGE